jgi:hypothetical protein
MADIDSAQSGNFTSGTTWVGGVVPGVGDRAVVLAGHVVTINSEVTCDEVYSGNNNGRFELLNGAILNAEVRGSLTVWTTSSTTGEVVINGSCIATTDGMFPKLINHNNGHLIINGSIGFDTEAVGESPGIVVESYTSLAPITINGDVSGGQFPGQNALVIQGNGRATINTDQGVYGGANNCFIDWWLGETSQGGVILNNTFISDEVGGFVYQDAAVGVLLSGDQAELTIVGGTVMGQTSPAIMSITSLSEGLPVINIVESTVASAYFRVGDGMGAPAIWSGNVKLHDSVLSVGLGDLGIIPLLQGWFALEVSGAFLLRYVLIDSDFSFYTATDINVMYQSPTDYPIEADVRQGVTYSDATLTGTLAVPDPSQVLIGVPTDDTVGTATGGASLSDITDAIEAGVNTVTAVTGAQLAAALTALPTNN